MLSIARTALVALLCTCASRAFVAADADSTTLETTTCAADCEAKWISRLIDLKAENKQLRAQLEQCRSDNVKQPLAWRTVPSISEEPDLLSSLARWRLTRHRTSTTTSEPISVPIFEEQPSFWPTDLRTRRVEDIVKNRIGQDNSAHRRKALTAPNPTSVPTPIPTASPVPTTFTPIPTTQSPSAAPSVSPVPTTEGVTTHSQLANAADASWHGSEIVVEADVLYPSSQAPITLNTARSVSVVGRSAITGDRVTLDGGGTSRLFVVTGGATLHLAFLNLANGTAPETMVDCVPGGDCVGGALLVHGGTIIMRSCEIRGGNHPVSKFYGNAFVGAGISFSGYETSGALYNVTFRNLIAAWGAAIMIEGPQCEANVDCFDCVFVDNIARQGGVVTPLLTGGGFTNFYDTVWERNKGGAFFSIVGPSKIVRNKFYDNVGLGNPEFKAGGVVINWATYDGDLSITDTIFERNIGGDSLDGTVITCITGGRTTLNNVSFIANTGYVGGVAAVKSNSKLTMIACYAYENRATQHSSAIYGDSSEIVLINSTFAKSVGEWDAWGKIVKCTFSAYNVVIRDITVLNSHMISCRDESQCSFIDCLITGNRVTGGWGAVGLFEGLGSALFLRTTMTNNHAQISPACLGVFAGTTLTIEDSDISDCRASEVNDGSEGGVVHAWNMGTATIRDSRISMSSGGGRGNLAGISEEGALRIIGGTITDIDEGEFAIYSDSANDFSLQLDSVTVDETVDIYSKSDAVIQNCAGFGNASAENASIALCAVTQDYCLPEACTDVLVGTDCICDVKGVQMDFPVDCMQSAVIAVPVPSTQTLTYIIRKPYNETAELMLANVRPRMWLYAVVWLLMCVCK